MSRWGCSHPFSPFQMPLFSSSVREGLHPPNPEATGDLLVVWSFLYMLIPLTILTVTSISIVSSGRAHQEKPNRKSQVGFNSQAIVCKNIYAGFIQFLLKDHWKPMGTNWSLVLTWCEWFSLHHMSNFEFIAIKSHVDLLPIYFYYILNITSF